jgi:PAS domain S-box-containing protein
MEKGDDSKRAMDKLRRKAEQKTARAKENLPEGADELRRLLYELQVHQVELEMQNQELMETQQRLHESTRRYYDLFELAPVGYLTLDLHGRILSLNQAAVEMLKVGSAVKVPRTPLFLFIEPGSREIYNSHIRRVSESLAKQVCELTLVGRDGSKRPVRLETLPSREEDRLTGLRCAIIDMTDRQQAFERLQEANRLLNRKTAELRDLSRQLLTIEHRERERMARLLHDHLQQLLVAAKLNLRSKGKSAPEVDDLLDQSITLSRSLVTELSPPVLHQKSLAEMLRWLARRAKELFRLEVEVEASESIDAASQEERILLFEIVRELLANVAKHARTSTAKVTAVPGGDKGIRIAVEDQGLGFQPEVTLDQCESCFGLFSIRHRLSWIGGKMKIDAAPGMGCRVEIFLPSRAQEEGPDVAVPVSRYLGGKASGGREFSGPLRVLIADDHKILRQGLASIINPQPDLELVGEAKDGREAIELARRLKPDVVIMDIEMPGTNGIDATRAIAAEIPDIRIVGLSMHTREDMEQTMRAAGASEYLPKDGPPEKLLAAIRGLT